MAENNQSTRESKTVDEDIEVCLIGSLILCGRDHASLVSQVCEAIKPSDFGMPVMQDIFRMIVRIYDRNDEVDIVTLAAELRDEGIFDDIGGVSKLQNIAESVPVALNAMYYAKIIKELSDRRIIISTCSKIRHEALTGGRDAKVLADDLMNSVSDVHGRNLSPQLYTLSHSIQEYLNESQSSDGSATPIRTGFNPLDGDIIGLVPGEMSVIAARPSLGKTALAMGIATNMAKDGVPVGFFSLEMARTSIAMRALSSESRINSHIIRRNLLDIHGHARVEKAQQSLAGLPLYIDDQSKITTNSIRSRTRMMIENHGVRVIFIDYIQIIGWPKYAKTEYEAVTQVSGDLKAIAKEFGIAVCVLSQIKRYDNESHKNPPKLWHLKATGAIEQDADIVMMIHTPSYYVDSIRPGESDIHIVKQRNGSTGIISLGWDKTTTTFSDEKQSELFDRDNYY